MSVSIDNGRDASEGDSRQVLSTWLDDYIAGRCDRAKMHDSFLAVCRSNPEAPWDALALLDQYQRRGRVDESLARSLKTEIAQLVFGVPNQTEDPPDTEDTVDTTGARWRKLHAQRETPAPSEPEPVAPARESRASADSGFAVGRRDFGRGFKRDTEFPRRDFEPPLTRPPPMARAPDPQDPATAPTDAAIGVGTILRDRYELMEILGSGPAGTLYQAFDRHRSHLPSPSCYVAVRVLESAREVRGATLAEIEREAYEAQSLSHPNIATVFDLDRHQDVYFVVMELLEGELLSDVMRRLSGRAMSRERALAVIGAVGSALMYAHQRGVVHGDLKPASIVLTTDGDVKVREFGFARSKALGVHQAREFDLRSPSVDGADIHGTLAYASAERLDGESLHPRDDVYSLACIAYELLSGRHPYGGQAPTLGRPRREPQKISGISLRQWNALQMAMHWNREERRIDVAGLLSALDCIEASAQTPTPQVASSLDNPFGRGKGVLLAILLIIALGALAWWQLPRFIEPASVSPLPAASSPDPAPQPTSEPTQTPPVAATPPPATPLAEELTESPAPGAIVAATAEESASTTPQTSSRVESPAAPAERTSAPGAGSSAAGAPTVEFDKDTYVATESDGVVTLTVRRNGSTRGTVRFRWALRPNSAEPGTDYAAIGPDIDEIPAGSRTTTISIPLVMDATPENTELFLVELEAVEGGPAIGAQAHAAVIIVDDD